MGLQDREYMRGRPSDDAPPWRWQSPAPPQNLSRLIGETPKTKGIGFWQELGLRVKVALSGAIALGITSVIMQWLNGHH